jgi:hypothetical protein
LHKIMLGVVDGLGREDSADVLIRINSVEDG